jgi:DNA repair protein RadC
MGDRREHYSGHRKRLRARFRSAGRKGLGDYELLEMLLAYAIPQRDTKPLAKNLIERFGTFHNIFDENPDELESVSGIGEYASTLIQLSKACMNQYMEPVGDAGIALSSPEAVLDYVRVVFGNKNKEFFILLCLNTAGRVVHVQEMSEGTVNMAHVYPREILKTALLKNASAVILVHNHPSGSLSPSSHDEKLTDTLSDASLHLGITVHDHIIVTKDSAYSIKMGKVI